MICLGTCFNAESSQAEKIYAPIFHPNGYMAWTGNVNAPFYYENYSVVWNGLKNPHSLFSYKNGQKLWEGILYNECGYNKDSAVVYHMNGKKAWAGASYDDSFFGRNLSTIYHDNGQKAWGGCLANETFTYKNSTVYHDNGQQMWQGASRNDLSYKYEPSYIYHANGSVAWRGGFTKDGGGMYSCGVYYSNGALAWSGEPTDPIYDQFGNISTGRATSIALDLGNCSSIHVDSNGFMRLFVGLGNSSSLIFTNQDQNPDLLMALDYPAYCLIFSPRTGKTPRFVAFDRTFPVSY